MYQRPEVKLFGSFRDLTRVNFQVGPNDPIGGRVIPERFCDVTPTLTGCDEIGDGGEGHS